MYKLTLDTNILKDWLWCKGLYPGNRYSGQPEKKEILKPLFLKLKELSDNQVCELGITTQVYTDCGDSAEITKELLESIIGKHIECGSPDILNFPLVFPVIFPDKKEIQRIFSTVFPDSKPVDKKYMKNCKDALQLYAHMVAARDYFITSDEAILRASEKLEADYEIKVLNLVSSIDRLK